MRTIQIGDENYIPVSRASEMLGYSRDYVTQLCRAGSLSCKRSSGQWFVLEQNISARNKVRDAIAHKEDNESKKEPHIDTKDDYEKGTTLHKIKTGNVRDDVLFFDKEEYITSSRAAEITGYAQDYVGELARSKSISARKMGRNWMIQKKSILEHKKEKDALLAGVQSESAGYTGYSSGDIPNKYNIPIRTRYFTETEKVLSIPKSDVSEEHASAGLESVYVKDDIENERNTETVAPVFMQTRSRSADEFFPYVSTSMYRATSGSSYTRDSHTEESKSRQKVSLSDKRFDNKPINQISDKRYTNNLQKIEAGTVRKNITYKNRKFGVASSIGYFIILVSLGAAFMYQEAIISGVSRVYRDVAESSWYASVQDSVPGRSVDYISK